MKKALETQVGGDHYKNMPYQPAQFIHDLKLRFNPGAIIKYISRDKIDKIEDLRKASHYCEICDDLHEVTFYTYFYRFFTMRLEAKVWKYVDANHFDLPGIVVEAIKAVATANWDKAKFNIGVLLDYYNTINKKRGC